MASVLTMQALFAAIGALRRKPSSSTRRAAMSRELGSSSTTRMVAARPCRSFGSLVLLAEVVGRAATAPANQRGAFRPRSRSRHLLPLVRRNASR
jgi:hypothetical protein